MRVLVGSISAAIVVLGVMPAFAVGVPCPDGRFIVQGPALVDGSTRPDAVVLSAGRVTVESGCPATAATVRAPRIGTRVRAKWNPCGSVPGRTRLRAVIEPVGCSLMSGVFRMAKLGVRTTFFAVRDPTPPTTTTTTIPPGSCGISDTFTVIQDRIFTARGCNLTTCHGNYADGGLDLRPGSSLLGLVDVPAANPVAASAGKKRVLPGNAAASFLSQKVHGTLLPGEGGPMPSLGLPLPQVEADLIDAWINAGAPGSGQVAGAPCLPPVTYEATPPPAAPPGGYQILLDGPTLQPGQEQEGCLWVPAPNASDFAVGKWEFAMNPGTHHFAIFVYNHTGTPTIGVWGAGDVGCISGASFGESLSGAPQSPYFIDAYPAGIARVLHPGTYLGLNAHYFNPFTVPIQIKVWTNLYPYVGTPEHETVTLIDYDDMFTISVPPFTQRVQHGRFTNTTGRPINIFQVTGHMHKRGLRFTAYASNGTKLYENFDWSHPIFRHIDPPFVLAAGDYIDFECQHDNGVTRPVKRDGAGNPTTLLFGLTTDDEMCTLNGQYYLN
jgi:hypothetical protein